MVEHYRLCIPLLGNRHQEIHEMFAYPHWKSTLVQSLFPGSSSLFRSTDPTGHWLKSQPQTIAFVVRLKFIRPNPFVTVFSTEPVPGYNSNTVKVTRVEYNIERKSPAGKNIHTKPLCEDFLAIMSSPMMYVSFFFQTCSDQGSSGLAVWFSLIISCQTIAT